VFIAISQSSFNQLRRVRYQNLHNKIHKLIFKDLMPKKYWKMSIFAIFDFANVQKMLQQVTQLQCVYRDFSQLIWHLKINLQVTSHDRSASDISSSICKWHLKIDLQVTSDDWSASNILQSICKQYLMIDLQATSHDRSARDNLIINPQATSYDKSESNISRFIFKWHLMIDLLVTTHNRSSNDISRLIC